MAPGPWVCTFFASLVHAQAPAASPVVLPLAQPPTQERIEAFLTAHQTEWSDGGDDFWLASNFRSGHRGSNLDCQGGWKASRGGVRANLRCASYDDAGHLKKRPSAASFELEVLLVGPDILVARPQMGGRLVMVCDHGKADCRQVKDAVLIQMIPGANDGVLWKPVVEALKAHAVANANVVLFESPRARTPRATTEVYFAEDPDMATPVAELLLPVTGPVLVQAWPGAWSYDVVVVAGAGKTSTPR